MNVLVTGNKGFIGSNLTKTFKIKGINLIPDYTDNSNINKIDILKKEHLQSIQESIDTIIHLAAKTSIMDSFDNPYITYLTNTVGTINILDFARERKIKKIINVSTYVYGKPIYLPINEIHPINPHTPYNKSKIIAENICKYYSQDFGIDIITLRPFYIYGPLANPFSFIPSVIRQITKNDSVFLSNANTKRDFLYVQDFIDLLIKVLEKFPSGYNIYNIGYGESKTLEEVVKIIEKIMDKKIVIKYDYSIRPNDIVDMVADITKVTKSFDWKPQIDIEKGLELTIQDINK